MLKDLQSRVKNLEEEKNCALEDTKLIDQTKLEDADAVKQLDKDIKGLLKGGIRKITPKKILLKKLKD